MATVGLAAVGGLSAVGVLLAGKATTRGTIGSLIVADPRFDALIPPDTKLEVIADGYEWAEGPVWVPREGSFLLWSDVPANTIYKWAPGQAAAEYMEPSASRASAHTAANPAATGSRSIARAGSSPPSTATAASRASTGSAASGTIADNWQGNRFNSPNDAVVKSNGDIYFTDPFYGLPDGDDDEARDTDFSGVYRWSAETGEVTLLTKELPRPNGVAFSPDEKLLYVANSDPATAIWMVYPVKADGTLAAGKVFEDVTSMIGDEYPGVPDGMRVDARGNIFAAGPGGVHVYAPDGTLLGRIDTGRATANLTFGGDGSDLYVAADSVILRVKTRTKGAGF